MTQNTHQFASCQGFVAVSAQLDFPDSERRSPRKVSLTSVIPLLQHPLDGAKSRRTATRNGLGAVQRAFLDADRWGIRMLTLVAVSGMMGRTGRGGCTVRIQARLPLRPLAPIPLLERDLTEPSSSRNYEISALKRGLAMLDCFLSTPTHTLTVTDVAQALGIHRATASRFLSTLRASGYLELAERQGSYRLASRFAALAAAQPVWPAALNLACVPILRNLAEATGETAEIGVLTGDGVMMVQVVEGPQSVRVQQKIGAIHLAHATAVGKALLASMSESALQDWIARHPLVPRTTGSVSTLEGLVAELARIRDCGYAVDDQEFELGLACVAAPVRDGNGATVASVAVSGPATRVTYHRIPEFAAQLQEAAGLMTALLRGTLFISQTSEPVRRAEIRLVDSIAGR